MVRQSHCLGPSWEPGPRGQCAVEFPLFSDSNCFVLGPGRGREGDAFGLK